MSSVIDIISGEVQALLAPVVEAVTVQEAMDKLLAAIGVVDGSDPAIPTALAAVSDLAQQCEALATASDPSFEAIAALLDQCGAAIQALTALNDKGGPIAGLPSLGQDLADLLVGAWLGFRHPILFDIGVLLSIVQPAWEQTPSDLRVTDVPVRWPFSIDRLRTERLVDLIRDPVGVVRAEYSNPLATDADAVALADKLFPRIQMLLDNFGVSNRYGIHPGDAPALADWAGPLDRSLVVFLVNRLSGAEEAGVVISISPKSNGDLGLVFAPFGSLNLSQQLGQVTLALQATAGIDVVAWGRHGPTLLASAGALEMAATATAALAPPVGGGPAAVFGSPNGTRLEVGGAKLAASTKVSLKAQSLSVSADVMKSTLVIAGGDGFIASILPDGGLKADFDLGLGWSSDTGVTLRGSAGLEANYPVGLTAAGVTLSNIHIGLRAGGAGLDAEVSATFAAAIGPVQATVERIGVSSLLSFPASGGNLGGADLAMGFKFPTGVGLAIDAHGVLTGGGFLSIDPASGTYGGVVQLSLHEKITLTGFGLISTHMPGGGSGFSLLVFITADGFQPVPLGFGFMLQGIGGMLGIHRTFDQKVLQAGLKSDTLAQLLFPADPVGNAPALLTALAAAFPVRQGSYLIGLLARITWFTPTLVQLDLALILELGVQTRLLVLGRVSALLPSRNDDIIRLNLDTIGVLDFDAGTFEADAVLVDSRLAHQFPVTGSGAVRARWSGSPAFVMAVGGLNPRFAPPAGFPQLDRLAIALCAGKNPQLICDSYFAITANTVQFGAHVSLYAEAFGFSVAGDLGFDALVTLSPPHFAIDFHASVQLKHGSHNLFKVTLDGTLEGPLPLRLSARATFEILWFSFSVHFDYTIADGSTAQTTPSIVLEDQVRAALADPTNWTTRSADSPGHGVALRSLPPGAAAVLDPLGQLVVSQQVAPLNTGSDVDTYGGVRVAGARRFNLAASFDGQAGTAVTAAFAPARYFTMTDEAKLVAPSFMDLAAGAVLGDDQVSFDATTLVAAPLGYDEFVLNPVTGAAPATPGAYRLPVEALQAQRPSGAAARAPTRDVGRARFRNPAVAPAATLHAPQWRVVQAYDPGASAPSAPTAPSADVNWIDGRAAVAAKNDSWVLAQTHEIAA